MRDHPQVTRLDPQLPTQAPDPDRALVARFRAGDRAAFDDLVRRHYLAIRQLARRYVGSEADANDIAQTALARAFEKLREFRGDSSFRTWLFRIAINVALNSMRGAPSELDQIRESEMDLLTYSLQTSQIVAAELWRKVNARLGELPPKQRQALELRIFHDLSFREIARAVHCSEKSAKANFRHAVIRLRALLGESAPG